MILMNRSLRSYAFIKEQFLGIFPQDFVLVLLAEKGKVQPYKVQSLEVSAGPIKEGHVRTPEKSIGPNLVVDALDQPGVQRIGILIILFPEFPVLISQNIAQFKVKIGQSEQRP